MCIARWFGGGNGAASNAAAAAAQSELQMAQTQQQQAAAAVAASNLDTEASRTAAELALRKANASQGFSTTIFGGQQQTPSVAYKALFGA